MVSEATVRALVGGRVPSESARWTKAAPRAAAGGGMRGTLSTLRLPADFVEKPNTSR